MKTETRTAGLFASATFLLIGIGSFIATSNPVHALIYGLISSFITGFIGHQIGYIITHPKGKRRSENSKHDQKNYSTEKSSTEEYEENTPLSGEETFLEDIGR